MGKDFKKRISLFLAAVMLTGTMSPSALAAAVEEKIAELGFEVYYNQLPQSDRSEIAELLGDSYENDAKFTAAYKEAWDNVVTLRERESAELIVDEDFEDGIDSSWTKGGSPETDTYVSLSPDGTGKNSLYIMGGAFGGGNTYIKNDFGERKAMVSLYFYETEYEWSESAFGVCVADDITFGVYGKADEYSINAGGSWQSLGKARSEGWHRVVFDTISQDNLKVYLDGEEVYSGEGIISYLQVGNLWNKDGIDAWYIDEISVIAEKQLTWADKFNAQTLTEDTLRGLLTEKQLTIFDKLPQCDRTAIVDELEAAKPYQSEDEVLEKYTEVLLKVTQYDSSKYELVFYEDFGDGITSAWQSDKKPAIKKFLNVTVDDLDIKDAEQKSAAFWGASITGNNGDKNVTGSNQTITRDVPANSYITLYFWDSMNDKNAYIGFKVNDNLMSGLYGTKSYYRYSVNGGSSWETTSIDRSKGWHKVVFDGATTPGTVYAYIDDVKLFEKSGTTEYLGIGNFWSVSGYDYYAVDNITVARKFVPAAENVTVNDHHTYISAEYDYSHTGGIKEGETTFQWYKKNDSGEFEAIAGATADKYYFTMPEDAGKTFCIKITPMDANGVIGDTVQSDEFTENYLSALMPDVKSVIIKGEAVVNSTLTAEYTAENAGEGSDKYRWYVSENGTDWTLLEGENGKTYKVGIDAIRMQIKCEVSVAGAEGSYSEWTESSNIVTDSSSVVQMIKAVQAANITGKNAVMLKLLIKCDDEFSSYSTSDQQKIAVKVISTSVLDEDAYQKLVEGILNGTIEVGVSDIDFAEKPVVESYNPMSAVSYTGFTDLDSAAWAKTAIMSLLRRQIVSGKTETQFCPNDNVTRAEFTAMLVKTFYGVNSFAKHKFKDIPAGSWYESYVATAYANGLVSGKDDGTFGPDEPITREEMAVLCARVISAGKCYADDVREYAGFDDAENISEYAYDQVVLMYVKGIINGIGENNFGAQDYSTRAMAAQMIYTMLGSPVDAADVLESDYVSEDFEDNKWIFSAGYPDNESVRELFPGTVAYKGTGSATLFGFRAATADAQGKRFFRIMVYDSNGENAGMDAVMTVEGDKKTYAIGAFTGKNSVTQGLYYQCRAGDTWYRTGIIKSVGWHEFIIDFSRDGYVDMYMDGILVQSFEDEGTVPERVVLGNIDTKASASIRCYADDFVMAKSRKIYEAVAAVNNVSGNALIRTTPLNIDTVPESLREAVGVLHSLNILAANTDGTLPLEEKITKEEFIYLLSGMQNTSAADASATKQYFNDVKLDRWSAGYIQSAVENGFISAEESKFNPEAGMNTADAIRMMLTLLGYSRVSEDKDSAWVLDTASRAGITKGVSTAADTLTWQDAIKLCFNVLDAKVLETNIKLQSASEFSTTDTVYLNYKFDVYKITETVNGIYCGEFTEDTRLLDGEMLLGNLVINTEGKQVAELNGMVVTAYVYATEDSDDYRLVYIEDRGKSNVLYLNAQDITACKNGQITYEENDREKRAELASELEVIKNGAYLFAYDDEDFTPDIGYVRLVDSDSDSVYDRAIIMDYKPVSVISYNPDTKCIYDEYSNEPINLYDVETITRNGAGRVFPELLTTGSVILVAVSEDGKRADILDNTVTVTGNITGRDGDKILIDNQEYYLSEVLSGYMTEKNLSGLQIGTDGEFAVDMFTTVIGVLSEKTQASVYAYIIRTWTDELEERVHVKMFTDTGKFIEVACGDKITIDDESGCAPELLIDVKPQLVRYKLKSDGTLGKVEFADTTHQNSEELKGSDEFWLYQDTEVWYRSQYGFGASLYTKSTTPVMLVPKLGNERANDIYKMSTSNKQFKDSKTYSYKAYNVNEFNYPDIILMHTDTTETVSLPKNIANTRMFVVKSLKSNVDDAGGVYYEITGWENGKETTYRIKDDVDFNQVKKDHGFETGWKMGDTFIAVTNYNSDLWEAFHYTSASSNEKDFIHSENEDNYTDLSSFAYRLEKIDCFYAKIDKFGDGIRFTDGTSYFVTTKPLFGIYVVNRTAGTVEKGSTADLISGRDAFVFAYHGKPYEIFVYVD